MDIFGNLNKAADHENQIKRIIQSAEVHERKRRHCPQYLVFFLSWRNIPDFSSLIYIYCYFLIIFSASRRKRCTFGRRGPVAVNASSSDSDVPHLVASLIVQKEEELAQILQPAPGKLPPKAAVVSSLRKEIAALRSQLKNRVAATLPPALADDIPPVLKTPTESFPTAAKMGTSLGISSSARSALMLVEQQLSVSGRSNNNTNPVTTGQSALKAIEQQLSTGASSIRNRGGQQTKLEVLQFENAQLRARLISLQKAIKQLKGLQQRWSTERAQESDNIPDTKRKRAKSKMLDSTSMKNSESDAEGMKVDPVTKSSSSSQRRTSSGHTSGPDQEVKSMKRSRFKSANA